MSVRNRSLRLAAAVVLALGLSAMVHGCDDEDDGGTGPSVDLVTVTGVVMNVDTGGPAKGVLVTLLESDYADEVATGDAGDFSIEVPKGTTLLLHTDDPPEAKADAWFPFINVEVPAVVADGDIDGLVIHACPASSGEAAGSVAVWDDYLANKDAANGDLFTAGSSAESAGIVTVVFVDCYFEPGMGVQAPGISDIQVTLDDPAFPVAYAVGEYTFDIGLEVQPEPIFYPAATQTDESGWVVAFGDPGFSGDSLQLGVSDQDGLRDLDWQSPIDIPVRPGTITLVWGLQVEGVVNASVNDFSDCLSSKK